MSPSSQLGGKRSADDLPHHGIVRVHEVRCAQCAAALGVAPAIVFAGEGLLITRFVEGATLRQGDSVPPSIVERIVRLLRRTRAALRADGLALWTSAPKALLRERRVRVSLSVLSSVGPGDIRVTLERV